MARQGLKIPWVVSFPGSAHGLRKDMYFECALAAICLRHRRDAHVPFSSGGTYVVGGHPLSVGLQLCGLATFASRVRAGARVHLNQDHGGIQ